MGFHVCNGAMLQCTFGAAPATLIVLPTNKELTNQQPAANIMDHKPMVNIPTFGVCTSPANPATKNPSGSAPCVPATSSPWIVGSPKVLLANMPALNDSSTLICTLGGTISIKMPGQQTHQIP